ncbi:UNKNOWN [Stylonychia lemnae]|uniref:Uncharacterized protein n=1 Tax=Stylonychia lemnae TaxID=5949 RepID=A0A078AMR7_STYLE|nr:UNKNOWN [Stylonychia lemnae]|eukprot:CDW83211.1 UNKNOWN [Stylonychia lemnae]
MKGSQFTTLNKFVIGWAISLTLFAALSRNLRWSISLYQSFSKDDRFDIALDIHRYIFISIIDFFIGITMLYLFYHSSNLHHTKISMTMNTDKKRKKQTTIKFQKDTETEKIRRLLETSDSSYVKSKDQDLYDSLNSGRTQSGIDKYEVEFSDAGSSLEEENSNLSQFRTFLMDQINKYKNDNKTYEKFKQNIF